MLTVPSANTASAPNRATPWAATAVATEDLRNFLRLRCIFFLPFQTSTHMSAAGTARDTCALDKTLPYHLSVNVAPDQRNRLWRARLERRKERVRGFRGGKRRRRSRLPGSVGPRSRAPPPARPAGRTRCDGSAPPGWRAHAGRGRARRWRDPARRAADAPRRPPPYRPRGW